MAHLTAGKWLEGSTVDRERLELTTRMRDDGERGLQKSTALKWKGQVEVGYGWC